MAKLPVWVYAGAAGVAGVAYYRHQQSSNAQQAQAQQEAQAEALQMSAGAPVASPADYGQNGASIYDEGTLGNYTGYSGGGSGVNTTVTPAASTPSASVSPSAAHIYPGGNTSGNIPHTGPLGSL